MKISSIIHYCVTAGVFTSAKEVTSLLKKTALRGGYTDLDPASGGKDKNRLLVDTIEELCGPDCKTFRRKSGTNPLPAGLVCIDDLDSDRDICFCDEKGLGFEINPSITDNPNGERGCRNRDECLDLATTECDMEVQAALAVFGVQFLPCVDHNRVTNPKEKKHSCICPTGSKEASQGDFGPNKCVLTCNVEGVCPDEDCINLDNDGGIQCVAPPSTAPTMTPEQVEEAEILCGSAEKPCNRAGEACATDGTQNCVCTDRYFAFSGFCVIKPDACDVNTCDENAECSTTDISAQDSLLRGYACSCNDGFEEVPNTIPGFDCRVDESASPSSVASSEPSVAPTFTKAPTPGLRPLVVPFCQRSSTECGENEVCSNTASRCLCKLGYEIDISTNACVCPNEISTSTNATLGSTDTPIYELTDSAGATVAIGNFSSASFCLADGIYTLSVTDPNNEGWEFSGDDSIFPLLSEGPSDLFQTGASSTFFFSTDFTTFLQGEYIGASPSLRGAGSANVSFRSGDLCVPETQCAIKVTVTSSGAEATLTSRSNNSVSFEEGVVGAYCLEMGSYEFSTDTETQVLFDIEGGPPFPIDLSTAGPVTLSVDECCGCGFGLTCIEGICVQDPPPGCTSGSCAIGFSCVEGNCVEDPQPCTSHSCDTGFSCVAGTCVGVNSCTNENECTGGPCIDGMCCPGSNVRSVSNSEGTCVGSQFQLTDTNNPSNVVTGGNDSTCGGLFCLEDGCYQATATGQCSWDLCEGCGPSQTPMFSAFGPAATHDFSVGSAICAP